MKRFIPAVLALSAALLCAPVQAQQQQPPPGQVDGPLTENPQYKQKKQLPANAAPPRSDDESSSEQTRLDLAPPKGDMLAHPNGGREGERALGEHEWNPLKAMKDVEVGDYYYGKGSYKAALSRYREALGFKPHDAVATFKLARTLEKEKSYDEARLRYEEYLTILKDGPNAVEARKALERLKKQ